MQFIETGFNGLLQIKPKIFGDERGYFFESYSMARFEEFGLYYKFVQDNESYSRYGTLRGLHFQKGDSAQAKFVRVVSGRVLDVVLDLRKEEKTFGKIFSVELNAIEKNMLLIPRGFAHGFVVLSQDAVFQYKVDNFYSPSNEAGISFDDPCLNIDWKIPHHDVILSEKDKKNFTWNEYLKLN